MTTVQTMLQLGHYIHFEVGEQEYLYHGLTGNIIALDEVARDFVHFAAQYKQGDQSIFPVEKYWERAGFSGEHQSMLKELEDLEIVRIGEKAGNPRFSLTPPVPRQTERMPVKTLVVHLVNECNLRCTYCYAGDGEYGAPKKYLSKEVAEQAVQFLMEHSYEEKDVTLVLFGGEPFLNWKVLRHLVEYSVEEGQKRGKRVHFSLTTNGTLLTAEQMEFLNRFAVGVSVSMDGTKEAHDRNRPMAGGQGSYDRVSRNVGQLMKTHRSAPVGTRVTVAKGFERVEQSLQHLLSKGFYEVGFAPVTETNPERMLADEDLFELLRQFEEIADQYVEHASHGEYLGFSNLTNILKELHMGTNKAYGCGAGLGFFAVSPDGNLYLCHRFNEDERFKMGNVYTGVDRQKQAHMLSELHIDQKESCQTCALKHICSGGCYYEAMERQGDFRRPNAHYCQWMHEWITMGLKTYVRILETNPSFLDMISGTGKEGCTSNT